jgi:hypothetical protein
VPLERLQVVIDALLASSPGPALAYQTDQVLITLRLPTCFLSRPHPPPQPASRAPRLAMMWL